VRDRDDFLNSPSPDLSSKDLILYGISENHNRHSDLEFTRDLCPEDRPAELRHRLLFLNSGGPSAVYIAVVNGIIEKNKTRGKQRKERSLFSSFSALFYREHAAVLFRVQEYHDCQRGAYTLYGSGVRRDSGPAAAEGKDFHPNSPATAGRISG